MGLNSRAQEVVKVYSNLARVHQKMEICIQCRWEKQQKQMQVSSEGGNERSELRG